MSAMELGVSGGTKLSLKLIAMRAALNTARGVRVGFLEDATYPGNDGGARLEAAADRAKALYDQGYGDASWEPRLRSWAAWQKTNDPIIHVAQVAFWLEFGTKTTKARAFFRGMISRDSTQWGSRLGTYLSDSEYNGDRAFKLLGTDIQDELKDSIQTWSGDNARLTVLIKGFNHGLVDHSDMVRAVDFEVTE